MHSTVVYVMKMLAYDEDIQCASMAGLKPSPVFIIICCSKLRDGAAIASQ